MNGTFSTTDVPSHILQANHRGADRAPRTLASQAGGTFDNDF